MAQLPPKVPTLPQDWSSFPHQTISNYLSNTVSNTTETSTTTDSNHHQASWVDGFLDFTAARRGIHHHRSISDSVTFFETKGMMQLVEDCNKNDNIINNNKMSGFERFDEDQLISMFSDNMSSFVPLHPWNPSSPSDQNSNNDDEKPQAMLSDDQFESKFQEPLHQQDKEQLPQAKIEAGLEEEEISCMQEPQHPPPNSFNGESVIDPKRVKRILANRQSAQRSRVRKLHYISELERILTTLQTEVSTLSPRVAFLDHQRLILNVDNSALKQRIAALAQDNIFKDAHQEALKKEIERLRQVYNQQNLNNNNICSTASKPC